MDRNDKFVSVLFVFFFAYFFFILLAGYYYHPEIQISLQNSFELLKSFLNYFFVNVILAYPDFPETRSFDDFVFLNSWAFVFSSFVVSLFIFYFKYVSSVENKLSSLNLSQYRFKYRFFNTFVFCLRKGEKMEYEKFLKNFENALQLFGFGSMDVLRHGTNCVKVKFKHIVPSVSQLKDKNILNYLQKEKIFLGFTGGYKKREEPVYISFSKLLHLGNFGTSGGGKSNTLNQIILSLIYNLELIDKIIFVDFKGGIEARPYEIFEEENKTGKIEVVSFSRSALLHKLREIDEINKKRMEYLKKKGLKQFKNSYIFLILDEVAEILQYSPITKEEKAEYNEIVSIFESLLRTGRSQGIRIILSTQSFVGNASGLSGGMKNNIRARILHKTKTIEAVRSVFPETEVLEKNSINPLNFGVGEFVYYDDDLIFHCRSLYIPEKSSDFVEVLRRALR